MADTKVSALTAASAAADTDEIPVNQGGTSKKVTRAQLFTAPTFGVLTTRFERSDIVETTVQANATAPDIRAVPPSSPRVPVAPVGLPTFHQRW